MKKIGLSIFLAFLITVGGAQPASAKLMIDIGQILGKVSDYLQKLSDTTQKITQQINQVKLMSVQGFNLDELRDLATEFFINQINLNQRIDKLIAGSKAKKQQVMQDNQDWYKKGAYTNFEKKKEVAEQDVNFLQGELSTAIFNYNNAKTECAEKYADYEAENEVVAKDTKWGIYVECKTRLDLYASQKEELNIAVNVMAAVAAEQQSREITARNKDQNYMERDAHKKALEEAARRNLPEEDDNEEAEFAGALDSDDEWDTEGTAEKYQKNNTYYRKFIRRYFYDPTDPEWQTDGESMVLFQSNLDRLNRERRFLFINTAVHLMQVAATTRRETGKRSGAGDKIANSTSTATEEDGAGKLSAMTSYSATRIEHIKTLLLYAQIQSAKLQYLAAKELLEAETRKEFLKHKDSHNYNIIDLNKYLMDETTE